MTLSATYPDNHRRQMRLIIFAGAAVIILTLLLGSFSLSRFHNAENVWETYNARATAINGALAEIQRQIGYGGFIHNFKNLVLRRDLPRYQPRIDADIAGFRMQLDRLDQLLRTPEDKAALAQIRAVLEEYAAKYRIVPSMVASGASSAEIDAVVKVDDGPAIKAFAYLSSRTAERARKAQQQAQDSFLDAVHFALISGFLVTATIIAATIIMLLFLRRLLVANTAISQTQARLDTLLDNAPDPMLSIMRGGRITRANRIAERFFGYSNTELLGMTIEQLIPERYRSMHAGLCDGYFAMPQNRTMNTGMEVTALTHDGREPSIEISLSVNNEGTEQIATLILRDITGKKQMENALRHSETKFRTLFDSTSDTVILLDKNTLVDCNNAALKMFGCNTREALCSKHCTDLSPPQQPCGTDSATLAQQRIATALEKGSLRFEWIYQRLDNGIPFPAEVLLTAMELDGKPILQATIRDISERKHKEAELHAAKEAAESLARMKSEFLTNMSHEIRTPLNAVLGLAQVGHRESAGTPVQRLFDQMLDSGEHLLGILNDILDLSKIEAGKLILETEVVSLKRLTGRIMGLVAGRAAAKGIALRVEYGADVPDGFMADSLRLSQVLTNLLGNAVKFTANGEVALFIDRIGSTLHFRVRDTGIGMSPDQLQCLFTPFVQADGSITRRYGGTGLGLTISKRLVELMGGNIRVESALGQGSLFEFSLPLVNAQIHPDNKSDDAGAALPDTGPRLNGIRILVAEDNAVNQLVLDDMLSPEGAWLVCTDDGLQALKCLMEKGDDAFDIVLTDIQMPNMDGHQLSRRIRELYPSMPVVGVTAHAFAEERQRCFDNGMVEHVTKPINLDALVQALKKHARKNNRIPPAAPGTPMTTSANVAGMADAVSPTPISAPDAGEMFIDWNALLDQFQGRHAFVDKLLGMLLQSHADTPAKLRAATRDEDLETLAFVAHSFAGVAGQVRADALRIFAKSVEQQARNGQNDAFTRAGELAALIERFLSVVQNKIADNNKEKSE